MLKSGKYLLTLQIEIGYYHEYKGDFHTSSPAGNTAEQDSK